MHMYRLEGSHYQIGAEYGALLRAARIRPPADSHTRLAFAEACEPHVRQHAPELLDELQGIIDGSGYAADRVKATALGLNARPACSVVAVAGIHTADGHTLVGRNFDWYYASVQHVAFCHSLPEGALASMGCNDVFMGRHGGINAAGVAIAITAVEGGRDHPGIMFPLATRIVLDRCRSTEEAVEFLQAIRHARTINFLVADSGGDLAIVEASPEAVAVIRPDNGFAAITNQFQAERMAQYEKVRRRPPGSYRRLCNLREWLAARQGPVRLQDVQAILSTAYPHGVCALPRPRSKRFGTIWSWSAHLGDAALSLADGPPHRTAYRTYAL
jgi:predicted choloylglycine hydrolase